MTAQRRNRIALTMATTVALGLACWGPREALGGNGSPAAASAGKPKADPVALYKQAQELYGAGHYKEAVAKLQRAVELDPKAKDLHYNLGMLHEKLQQFGPAIASFERVLELEKVASERKRVEAILKRLRGAEANHQAKAAASASAKPASSAPPPAASAPVPSNKPTGQKGRLDGWVYGTGGVAVLALAGGVFFGLRAVSQEPTDARTTATTSFADLQAQQDDAKQSALISDISFGAAIALGATAAYLYFSRDAEPSGPSMAVMPTRGGAAAAMQVTF